MARPSSYTQELAGKICEGIAQGNSLVKVCYALDIDYGTVYDWIKKHPDFADNYTHAREAQADYLADGVLDIADDSTLMADDRRVKIDARKWYAGKLKPKKYGDKIGIGGADDLPPVGLSLMVEFVKSKPENIEPNPQKP
ncbi:hypothetical protein UFOVP191_10 [uncultured Caudovirales phage]|uniref:Terminase small subunit n=1 Tax=uncultured Caudovirales phage TaxID=2100421 RepID=A0A6J7WIL8_9CAUD|nr:hypothetical protein UFOVP191_10 [uncultured Caudovirales phage]